jgi:integrase
VTGAQVQTFLEKLKVGPRTYNNYLASLRTLFTFAKKKKYLLKDFDELDSIPKQNNRGGDILIFTPEEMNQLLLNSPADFVPCMAISAFAGIRSQEIERLDWSDIHIHGAESKPYIEVGKEKAKTRTRRLVPVSKNLIAWLLPYSKPSGPVWPHSHAYYHECQRTAAKKSGMKWRTNALRHSWVSYRLARIHDTSKVAMEAGNSPDMIFRNYRELVKESAAETWFNILPPNNERIFSIKSEAAA